MFPPIPTTPFRNSPSIDALSPRPNSYTHHHHHHHTRNQSLQQYEPSSTLAKSLLPEEEEEEGDQKNRKKELGPLETVGDPTDGTDVPVELLRSVILSSSISQQTAGNNPHPSTSHLTTPSRQQQPSKASPSPSSPEQIQRDVAARWDVPTIAYAPVQVFPPIRHLPGHHRKRILVTGGAGFVGSHLVIEVFSFHLVYKLY
jgi:UDP-glucuronate decarboxylase